MRTLPARLVSRALLSLFAGSLLTYAAAWVCWACPHSWRSRPLLYTEVPVLPEIRELEEWQVITRAFGHFGARWQFDYMLWPHQNPHDNTPPQKAYILARAEFGWPFRSIIYEKLLDANKQVLRSNLLLGVPVRPRAAAYAANVSTFAAAIFTLSIAPAGLRWFAARRRAQEGLCPHCAYDLRGLTTPCPECGRYTSPEKSPFIPSGENPPASASGSRYTVSSTCRGRP